MLTSLSLTNNNANESDRIDDVSSNNANVGDRISNVSNNKANVDDHICDVSNNEANVSDRIRNTSHFIVNRESVTPLELQADIDAGYSCKLLAGKSCHNKQL